MRVSASLDYVATASDDGVLKLPARTELDPEEIKDVFSFPRCVCAWCCGQLMLLLVLLDACVLCGRGRECG